MASAIEICNLALAQLGQTKITNLLAPTNASEELCALHYPLVRDALLEQAEWSFSIARHTFDNGATSSANWGYSCRFPIGNDFLRILFVSNNQDEEQYNPSFRWAKEDNAILADSKVIYVKAIKRVEDTTKFPPMFVQAISSRLALELCIPLTENQKLYSQLERSYFNKVQSAATINSMQGRSKRLKAGQLLASR